MAVAVRTSVTGCFGVGFLMADHQSSVQCLGRKTFGICRLACAVGCDLDCIIV